MTDKMPIAVTSQERDSKITLPQSRESIKKMGAKETDLIWRKFYAKEEEKDD
jgi:hypothetical protein